MKTYEYRITHELIDFEKTGTVEAENKTEALKAVRNELELCKSRLITKNGLGIEYVREKPESGETGAPEAGIIQA